MAHDVLALAHALIEQGEPFALATVVRCDRPTSSKPGAKALVRRDGTVFGWIGGSCAEPVVVKEALHAIVDGQPRLVALLGDRDAAPARAGVVEHAMSCHSGGTLEIFVEPVLPRLQVLVVGRGPVAETLVKLGEVMDHRTTLIAPDAAAELLRRSGVTPQTSIVVVTHGASDEDALEQALATDARYVSLVASRRRAAVIAEGLRARGVPQERLDRLRAPAGLDLGGVTPAEIAASILAEIVQVSRAQSSGPAGADRATGRAPSEARDPVCGMSVDAASAEHRSEVRGRVFYFCCAGCKRTFDGDPARYAAAIAD